MSATMSAFPGSPRTLKGGLVLLDARTQQLQRVIPLQYNPDSLSRTLQTQAAGGDGGDRSEALRLKGPPVETITLEAEIDATDLLERGDAATIEHGIAPQLAALEVILYPDRNQLLANRSQADRGVLEIAPVQAPLVLFVWSKSRIMPVRVTEFRVTEEAFDPKLNPIRAKVSLGLRVLSVNDLGFDHKGGSLFLTYQQRKDELARLGSPGGLDRLGLGAVP